MKDKRLICFVWVVAAVFILQAYPIQGQQPQEEIQLTRKEKIQKAKQYYAAGEKYLQEANYVSADESFKKAQELLKMAQGELALPEAAELPRLQELPPAIKARDFSQEGNSKQAIIWYLKAIEVDMNNSSLYYNLGVECLKTNQFYNALDAFLKVMKLNPRDKDACYNIGVLYEIYIGDKKAAKSYYKKYIKLAGGAEDASQVNDWVRQIDKTQQDTDGR